MVPLDVKTLKTSSSAILLSTLFLKTFTGKKGKSSIFSIGLSGKHLIQFYYNLPNFGYDTCVDNLEKALYPFLFLFYQEKTEVSTDTHLSR